jgi:hypothetical protein
MIFKRILAQARERSNILFYKMIDENKNELDERERNEIMTTLARLNKEEEMRYLMSNYGFKVKDIDLTYVVLLYNSPRNSDKRRTLEIIKMVMENDGIKEEYVYTAANSGEFSLTMYLLKMFKHNSREEIDKMKLMKNVIEGSNVELFKELIKLSETNDRTLEFTKKEKQYLFREIISNGGIISHGGDSNSILEYILSDSSVFEEDKNKLYENFSGYTIHQKIIPLGIKSNNPTTLGILINYSKSNSIDDNGNLEDLKIVLYAGREIEILEQLLENYEYKDDVLILFLKMIETEYYITENDYWSELELEESEIEELLELFDGYIVEVSKYIKESTKIIRLRNKIKESYKRQEFKWQDICSKLNKEGKKELEEVSKELGIKYKGKSKRELCKLVSEEMFNNEESCEDTNLLGDEMDKLPKWRIYKIKGKCYDIMEMMKIIEGGETRNPYTREELPIEGIRERYKKLESLSVKGDISSDDLFTNVRDNPIFTKKDYLNKQVVKLFGMFPYMLDIELITKASDLDIESMSNDLFNTGSNIVLRARRNEISVISGSTGEDKKILFVTVLLNDINEEKIHVLYSGFSYFLKKKNGEDLRDDRFLFMISQE